MEFLDVNLFSSKAIKSPLHYHFLMFLIFKELQHVDDKLWFNLFKILLQNLDGVYLKLKDIEWPVIIFFLHFCL